MTGSVTKRGENSWRLKFDIGKDANGKRITRYHTVEASGKKEARAKLAS